MPSGSLKNGAGNNWGVNKESVLFLCLEFQESGAVAQACAEGTRGSPPSTQWPAEGSPAPSARRPMGSSSHPGPEESWATGAGETGSERWSPRPTLCDLMGCSLPGSSVHGIFQARILEWRLLLFSPNKDSKWVSEVTWW